MSCSVPAPGPGENRRSRAGWLAKDVFDALEERLLVAVRLLVELLLRQRARELLEQLPLLLRELLRHCDACDDVEVAVAAAADVRHAFSPQLEPRAGLRARRDVQLLAPVQDRHLDRAAERERRKTDRHL